MHRLYIAQDDDAAGRWATGKLTERAQDVGIDVLTLLPSGGDFNDDLRRLGPCALAASLRTQLYVDDATRFLIPDGDSRAA